MSKVAFDRTLQLRLRRLAVGVLYWLAVLVIAALLVLALLRFLESRDASSLDSAAAHAAGSSFADRRHR